MTAPLRLGGGAAGRGPAVVAPSRPRLRGASPGGGAHGAHPHRRATARSASSRSTAVSVSTPSTSRRRGIPQGRAADSRATREVRAVVLRGLAGCSAAERTSSTSAPAATPGTSPTSQGAAARCTRRGYGAVFKQILEYIHSTISEIRRAPKPFIAAVDGIAAAGGFGLAMACDLVFASERATFEWAYGKTGLTGAESSTFLLPRLIGLRRAMELVLLNPRLDAQRSARDMGLVNGGVPRGELRSRGDGGGARSSPRDRPQALAIAKELLNQAAGMDRLDCAPRPGARASWRASRTAPSSPKASSAFFDKRAARFRGDGERVHEYSIVQALFDSRSTQRGARAPRAVVRGASSCGSASWRASTCELLATAFEIVPRADDLRARASSTIEPVAARWVCPALRRGDPRRRRCSRCAALRAAGAPGRRRRDRAERIETGGGVMCDDMRLRRHRDRAGRGARADSRRATIGRREHNREHFRDGTSSAVNLMGSPGAGKTAVLEATARRARRPARLGALAGDLATDRDAAAPARAPASALASDHDRLGLSPRRRDGAPGRCTTSPWQRRRLPLHRERRQPGLPRGLRPRAARERGRARR